MSEIDNEVRDISNKLIENVLSIKLNISEEHFYDLFNNKMYNIFI